MTQRSATADYLVIHEREKGEVQTHSYAPNVRTPSVHRTRKRLTDASRYRRATSYLSGIRPAQLHNQAEVHN